MARIPVIFHGETASAVRSVRALRGEMNRLEGEERQVSHGARRAHTDLDRMGRGALAGSGAFRHLGRSVAFASGAFLGAAGFVSVIRKSVDAARDLEIQQARSRIVFGDSAKSVVAWSKTATRELALVRSDALTTANSFGTMLTAMKVAPGLAGTLAQQMVRVAAAISLARGEDDPASAARAIVVALAGRGRALRQYGIILDEVSIKAEALRLGLTHAKVDAGAVERAQLRLNIATAKYADAVKQHGQNSTQAAGALLAQESAHAGLAKTLAGSQIALTNEQKAQAASSLVIQQGGRFVKNYGKLMQTTAGQQRQFRAGVDDLEEQLGQRLIPTFVHALRVINPYLRSLDEGGSRHRQFVKTTHQVGSAIRAAAAALRVIYRMLNSVVGVMGGWGNAFKLILSLYLANKFLKLAKAIRDSRLALLLLGETAPGVATTVVASEAAMAAGVAAPIGRVAALRVALLGLATSPWAIAVAVVVTGYFGNKLARRLIGDSGTGLFGLGDATAGGPGDTTPRSQRGAVHPVGYRIPPATHKGNAILVAQEMRANGVSEDAIYKSLRDRGYTHAEATRAIVQTRRHGRYGSGSAPAPSPEDARTSGRLATGRGRRGAAAIAVSAYGQPGHSSPNFRLPNEGSPPDCSAFVQAVFRRAGISIGRDTYAQARAGLPVSSADIQPGDIVLWDVPGDSQAPPNHVGIYVGGGQCIHDRGRNGGVEQIGYNYYKIVTIRRVGAVGKKSGDNSRSDPGTNLTVDHGPGRKPPKPSMASPASIRGERHTIGQGILDLKGDLAKKYVTPSQYAAYIAAIRKILRALARPHLTSAQLAAIRNQWRALWDQIARTVKRGSDRVRAAAAAAAAAHRKALEGAERAADAARTRFGAAWGKMADNILNAFDRISDAGRRAIEDQYAAATPAEAALQALQARRSAASIAGDIGAAQTKLQRALEIGDPAMIAEARQELQDANDNALEAQLTSQAEIERAARDKARDDALREYEDAREIQRKHLQDMLDDLQKKLDDGTISWAAAQEQLKTILGDNLGPIGALGALIGSTFTQNLLDSVTGVGGAAAAIQAALDEIKALGYRWNPDTGEWEKIAPIHAHPRPPRPPGGGGGGAGGGAGGGGGQQDARPYTNKPLAALLSGPNAVVPASGPSAAELAGGGGSMIYVENINLPRYLGEPREAAQEIRRELIRIQRQNAKSILTP